VAKSFSSFGSARLKSSVHWGRFCLSRVELDVVEYVLYIGGGRGNYFSSSKDEVTAGFSVQFGASFRCLNGAAKIFSCSDWS